MARKSKANYARLLEQLQGKGVIWFTLGSLISADAYMCSNEEGIVRRKESIRQLQGFVDNVDKTNIPEEEKSSIRKFSLDGIELLTKEIGELQELAK